VISRKAQTLRGLKAKLFNKERFAEKVRMKKQLKAHEEKDIDVKVDEVKEGAVPTYLMDR
jgi:ribosome biogenesis protein NSA2